MKIQYHFSVLRFVYDPLTQEFVNVGIVIYSPETKQLRARCASHYGRISKLFEYFNGVRLRQTLRFLQDQVNDVATAIETGLVFRPNRSLEDILTRVLPKDDSSLQFVRGGVGVSEDLYKTADSLFDRYVDKYKPSQDVDKRGDDDVWRSFRVSLDRRNVTSHLVPKRIVARDYEYEFQHSWKNGVWNLAEPLSFDLLDASSMQEKANRWVGRTTGLADSRDAFKLLFLLGAPSDTRLQAAYHKAENLLHRCPVAHTFIRESEAEDFARGVESEMQRHRQET